MTREQVKQELKELKYIRNLIQKGVNVDDKKGLEKKYDKAMEHLNCEEKTILFHHIYLNEPHFKIAMLLNYCEESVRKKYSKIIDKLANMVEIKKTNFDRITENEEALAEYISSLARKCTFRDCSKEECAKFECKDCIKEWLQKECEE